MMWHQIGPWLWVQGVDLGENAKAALRVWEAKKKPAYRDYNNERGRP
jgi:hypothetical protein